MAVVLVVEDDAILRAVMCRHLARRGHAPVPAGTGSEALRRAARRAPGVALLDLRLPDTDGLTLFRQLRRQLPQVVGVIMTGYGSVPSAVECLHAGIAEYVEKPFTLDAMVALVEGLGLRGRPVHATLANLTTLPAERRLAIALVCGLDDPQSITSFPAWGHSAGAADSALRMWCEAAHVPPRAALDFRRGLVAVMLARQTGAHPQDLLGFADVRSIERFLLRCGPLQQDGQLWTVAEFCRLQRVLPQTAVVAEVIRLLGQRGLLN